MTSNGGSTSPSSSTRSYLVMKANTEIALKLAEEWWNSKTVPDYVHVRGLVRTELPDFVALYNRCFLTSPDPFCPLSVEEAELLELEGIFVAELWDKLSGFIACFVEKDDDSIYGEITGLGVLAARRRKGIATALIMQASEYFIDAGVEEVYCEVYEANTPSQMLIHAYGFEEVGRREIPLQRDPNPPPELDLPGGKIMRRLGLRPRPGCEDCRDI
ncbi:MAG: GNAT family N-acetyltransferase [Candidatus Thorarchaeota archaeon]